MAFAIILAMIFGIFQGINSISNPRLKQSVPHTDNLLEYIFDTKHKI